MSVRPGVDAIRPAGAPWLSVALLLGVLGCRSGGASVGQEPTSTPSTNPASAGATPEARAAAPGRGAAPEAAAGTPSRAAADTPAGLPTQLGPLAAHFVGAAPASAEAVVVLLHGFGDSGDGLVDFARGIAETDAGLAAVALEARLPRAGGGRMWWPIDIERVRAARARGDWPELERQRPAGADEARDAVVLALRQLHTAGVPRERLVLAGFSQGAMLAVDVGLSHPDLLRGVVAFSGAVLDRERWEQRTPTGVRFVVAHGQRDTMLPFAQGEALHSLLQRHDPRALWVPFDGPHTISPEGRAALLELLGQR